MSKSGMRWTDPAELDRYRAKRERQKRGEPASPPVVGTANAFDRPLQAREANGNFASGPKRRPYWQCLTALLREHNIPEPKAEYRFDRARKWRFDFAWVEARLAVEIDGGLFLKDGGAHNRGLALLKQYEKSNAAALAGWRILRYTPQQLTECARDVVKALKT